MRHMLLARGLWGQVDGTDKLAEGANAAVRAEFLKKSQKAFSIIVMAVSTPQLYLITSCEEPKEAWDKLREHFECKTLANKLFLKKQYFRTQMQEGASIDAHLKHMKEITDRLAAIGAPISEEDQVVTLLGSLPHNYSTLVTALEARVDSLTLSFVQQSLIHEEQKINEMSKDVPTTSSFSSMDTALMGKCRRDRIRKPLRCFGCHEIGHIRRNCPKEKRDTHRAKTATEE